VLDPATLQACWQELAHRLLEAAAALVWGPSPA